MKTQLLTLDQVAQELRRSTSWVRLEIKANRLAYIKTGGRYWVRYDDLVDYLEQRRVPATKMTMEDALHG
jgi:excisionase family DNA binding protein